MFDIGAQEILIIVVVAVLVIGPKDLPLAMRTAGRWLGKMRRVSGHFRSGIETMIREAEMEDMEKKWKEQNERIMAQHPQGEMQPINSETMAPPGVNKAGVNDPPAASADSKAMKAEGAKDTPQEVVKDNPPPPPAKSAPKETSKPAKADKPADNPEPQLPLGNVED